VNEDRGEGKVKRRMTEMEGDMKVLKRSTSRSVFHLDLHRVEKSVLVRGWI